MAIKGNREPRYTTPVSLAKLKQITPTSIAYYEANDNNLFIIRFLIHLFDHGWHPAFIFPHAPLHHFLFVNMTDGGLSYEGQLDFTFLKNTL